MSHPNGREQGAAEPAASTSTSSTNSWGGWFEAAKDLASKAQVIAENAGKIAQEKAQELAKQAEEMRKNYDFDKATSILMGTVGGPIDPSAQGHTRVPKTKSLKQALEEMDMVYVTENLVSMAFPYDYELAVNQNKVGNDIDVVAALLRKRHHGHFMIWNVSEEQYCYAKFADQVLEYKFPGHPAPPLGLLFKICTSVESWLDADERNVAVVHCLTGKGRTAALLACIMAWIGEFSSPMEALQYTSDRRKIPVDLLTIPSQRRYIQYFSNMLDGVKPRAEPLLLRRVIINSIPVFGRLSEEDEATRGCCPYIQLFKNGRLIATAAPQMESTGHAEDSSDRGTFNYPQQNQQQLRWIRASDGSASFTLDCPIQGDILLRCRHAAKSGARVSMFRCGFHTGYVPSGVLRLTKAQLDGSSSDHRYDEDFFIDLIFAPILTASNIAPEAVNTSSSVPRDPANTTAAANPSSRGGGGVGGVNDSGLVIDATSTDKYEQSLHKDTKFWESISSRKQRAKRRKSRKFLSNQQEQFSIMDDGAKIFSDMGDADELDFLAQYSSIGGGSAGGLGGGARGGVAGVGVGGAGIGSAGSSTNSVSGLSDMELIMQLAQAEGEESGVEDAAAEDTPGTEASRASAQASPSSGGSGGGSGSNSGNMISSGVLTGGTVTVSDPGTDISDDYADATGGSIGAGNNLNGDNGSAVLASSPGSQSPGPAADSGLASPSPAPAAPSTGTATPNAATGGKKASSELQELEDLEKELGIDFFGGGGGGGGTATSAPSTAGGGSSGNDDGDLDELEKYLQSFSTK